MELSEIHDCDKCHGKIVAVSVDILGNTHCGYCGERVDYNSFFKATYPKIWEQVKQNA